MTESAAGTSCARWPLLAAICWAGVVGGAVLVAAALLWRDRLEPASGVMLRMHYAAFMAQTFAYHAGAAMIPVVVFAAAARRRRLLIGAAVVMAAGAGPALRTLWPASARTDGRETLKIMSVNLMYGHCDMAALIEQIEREDPDVVLFQEWTARTSADLRPALGVRWPHAVEEAREDAFGQAVFSRRAFAGPARSYPPVKGFGEPQVTVEVEHAGKVMRLTDVHLMSPVNRTNFAIEREMARGLVEWLSEGPREPDVLAGDFNAVAGSAVVGAVCGAGYREAQREAGWWRGSTWPRVGALRYAPGIRLDHVLLGERVECVECRVGEEFGSDHAPVIAVMRWREDAAARLTGH